MPDTSRRCNSDNGITNKKEMKKRKKEECKAKVRVESRCCCSDFPPVFLLDGICSSRDPAIVLAPVLHSPGFL